MVEMTVPAYLDERGNPALSHEPNFLPDTPHPNDTSTPDHSAAGSGVNLLIYPQQKCLLVLDRKCFAGPLHLGRGDFA
jgi:hypothetical protein